MNINRRGLLCTAIVILLFHSAANAIPIPSDPQYVKSLDGTWRFKLEQAIPPPKDLSLKDHPIPPDYPATFEPFYQTNYQEGAAWKDIAVPGNWEIPGYSPATYNQPDNASAFYRLRFKVPAQWRGRQVRINFDGVQNGCEIWCNGQPVAADEGSWGRTNYHESGWTAWQADLTPAVKFGEENLLALRVTKNTKSVNCDTGDFYFLGGVYRPVTLFAVPAAHLEDVTVRTTVESADQATVSVLIQTSDASSGTRVTMQLEGQPALDDNSDTVGNITLTQAVAHPRLWSAEFPNLYDLAVDLKDARGTVLEHWSRKIGIREISITNGVFYVNHVPVKLVGICRHDVSPANGSAVGPDLWKKDLTLMKAANFNAVRTSHYPYGSGFYDLCDQMGFYVLDEEPFCWVDCKDTNLLSAFAQRAREAVRRDKNHPCVVIWGIGNENQPGPDNTLAAHLTRELDPTRPRLVSTQKAEDGGADVEFDDEHYVTADKIHKAENDAKRRAKWPMIYSENPNVWEVRNGPDYGSLDLWAEVIVRTWNELWQDDHVTGSFLWEWQDRAVADANPHKYYSYFPKTGINLVKVKGVVDGFRNPRPEYYHIKMAQSPVVVGREPEIGGDFISFEVTNHYSFTDVSLLNCKWSLMRGAKENETGVAHLAVAPRSHGSATLYFSSASLAAADTLRLEFDHPGGWNVATYLFPLKSIPHPAPQVRAIDGVTFPTFNLVVGQVVPDDKGWRHLVKDIGELVNLKVSTGGEATAMDAAALSALPLAAVRSLDSDVRLQGGSNIVGQVHAEYSGGQFNWHFVWTAGKTNASELGWIFHLPKGIDHFSWDRHARWSYYPKDHIGRPDGTATPDSAMVDVTKVDRPDAFDFNSTKFYCNWASLTGSRDRGICVEFPADQREDVRGGVEPDGSCDLIVDRCYSPPNDISTAVVPDLYTDLKKGDQVAAEFTVKGVVAPR